MTSDSSNNLIRWPSPAKLNLFLHITGRQENGYHQLQSLFQILDYGDELSFEVTDNNEVTLMTPIAGVDDEDNLIIKAARLLQSKAVNSPGCKIWLKKNLPMGGGVGGGSSNAATTLVALNHLWSLNLSITELAEMGLSLGADVPIFIHGNTAFAEGVGEKLSPVNISQKYYLVAFPDCPVSTAEVFSHPALPRDSKPIEWTDYDFVKTRNDCQQLVCNSYPAVAKLLNRLLEYAPSRMTGTGACLFAVFDDEKSALSAKYDLGSDVCSFVSKGVNKSRLQLLLTSLKLQK